MCGCGRDLNELIVLTEKLKQLIFALTPCCCNPDNRAICNNRPKMCAVSTLDVVEMDWGGRGSAAAPFERVDAGILQRDGGGQ